MRSRRLAAVLLAVLLGHLAFMASPLHAVIADSAHGESARTETVQQVRPAVLNTVAPLTGHDAMSGHCAMEAAPPAQRPLFFVPIGVLGATAGQLPDVSVPARCPFPRFVGPPGRADPQALLQVFRI
jgi:hypothetical protein